MGLSDSDTDTDKVIPDSTYQSGSKRQFSKKTTTSRVEFQFELDEVDNMNAVKDKALIASSKHEVSKERNRLKMKERLALRLAEKLNNPVDIDWLVTSSDEELADCLSITVLSLNAMILQVVFLK